MTDGTGDEARKTAKPRSYPEFTAGDQAETTPVCSTTAQFAAHDPRTLFLLQAAAVFVGKSRVAVMYASFVERHDGLRRT